MYFSTTTAMVVLANAFILAGTLASPVTPDTNNLSTRDCGVYAKTVSTWHENAMSRRRVNWETNKGVSEAEMKRLTKKWGDGKESKHKSISSILWLLIGVRM